MNHDIIIFENDNGTIIITSLVAVNGEGYRGQSHTLTKQALINALIEYEVFHDGETLWYKDGAE